MNVSLDHYVTIERKVLAQDPTYGSTTHTWAPLDSVWAEVQDMLPSRSEAVRQGLAQARNQTRVRMRYRTDVDASMRIIDGSRVLQIVAGPAEVGGRQAYLEMVCETSSTPGA